MSASAAGQRRPPRAPAHRIRRCAPPGLRRGPGSPGWRRPGSGRQQGAYCTEAFFAAVQNDQALRHGSRARCSAPSVSSSASGFSPRLRQQRHQALGHDAGDLALAQADVGQQLVARAVAGKAQQLAPTAAHSAASLASGGCSRPSARSACASSFSPSAATPPAPCSSGGGGSWSARGRCARSQPGRVGRAPGAVMISTTSPLRSSVRSGHRSPLTLAATQWSPTSEWMA
jgi:hypothetical protein